MRWKQRLIYGLVLGILLLQFVPLSPAYARPTSQDTSAEEHAQQLLERMTPEERIGQLFLITFMGSEIANDSPIRNLITNHHIGGVVLKRNNDNFSGPDSSLQSAWQLTQDLQQVEWDAAQQEQLDPLTSSPYQPEFVPLFIGIAQNGDSAPYDQIYNGLTALPSPMAIGATWNLNLAYQSGEILGKELSTLGFNLLLSPSLDVLEDPQAERVGDLGVRSFGGNPNWVARMGQSYISGIHTGSNDQMVVAANHFPGLSSADRPLEEEIPTVRKSLEQLMQTELVPFFAVTGEAPDQASTIDGLILAHAKYEGLQGNISTTTNPISFDPQAFEALISISQFETWRQQGGLILSEELGTRAIRRFEDPSEATFNARLVTLNAFLAGNDLLNLGDFTSTEDPTGFTNTLRTLDFFALKYRDDVAFSQRVDEAVLRILTTKFRLYENFTLENVHVPEIRLQQIDPNSEVTFDIARQAATLLSPASGTLENVLPSAPTINEKMVVITDTYTASQCTTCTEQYILSPNALKSAILRLYGPASGGRVLQQNIMTYSFADLQATLNGVSADNQLFTDIQQSDWVVFLVLDSSESRPASSALRDFLSRRTDLIQNKKSVVFALNAPYYLDATDISNTSAYYGLYSKQPVFIEVAARILFKELNAPGASPVSVRGVAYDLNQATAPEPEQAFGLTLTSTSNLDPDDATPVAEGEIEPEYFLGDPVNIATGVILDHNKHPVPDNTPIRLSLQSTTVDGNTMQREYNAVTKNGISQFSIVLEIPGALQIQAFAGTTTVPSEIISIDVADPFGQGQLVLPTSSLPSDFTQLSPSPTPVMEGPNSTLEEGYINAWHWVLLILVTSFISLFAYQIGATSGKVRWGVRWGLSAFIGGMLATAFFSFGLAGSPGFIIQYRIWGLVIATALLALVGWGVGWVWTQAE